MEKPIEIPLKSWFTKNSEITIPWFAIRAKDGYVD
jgi:hypothetical protein